MSLTLEDCKSIPVWVKLSKVPVQYWTKLGLSYIASVLGKPLHMDVSTTYRHASDFAQVCVDMAATSTFPNNIILELEDGNTTNIGVEYPWRPASCTLCKVFDHSNKTCPRAVLREWLPKPVVMAQRKPDDVEGWITVKRKGNPTEQVLVPAQLDLPHVEEVQGGREEVAKQAPKTPMKSTPSTMGLSSASLDDGGGMVKEVREVGCCVGRTRDIPKVLLIGSSSNHNVENVYGNL
ncbi:DUF4283 domain-containing protein/zf-CCHC_4 domain-containing protein [Cephalotus follicularis]|uniref:DUF4283 domain-containing protein/zf-CCHC_4 domain-containing protein n=1 Tax=Cephalotus follicularis TaxID=3775 RepID=A0A1Q3B0P3_CEPFO|nr:DUF4283 domain-containing protein/zf-CCHC_4 domain-containing protein [Cephalotus follicularis]